MRFSILEMRYFFYTNQRISLYNSGISLRILSNSRAFMKPYALSFQLASSVKVVLLVARGCSLRERRAMTVKHRMASVTVPSKARGFHISLIQVKAYKCPN